MQMNMKKFFLISILMGGLPLSMVAQDDLYFVPKKKSEVKVTDKYGMPRDTYYSGSNRSVDEYNRRGSSYEVIDNDTTANDIIDFSGVQGVYPDSVLSEDYKLTKKMQRFEDYDISDNAAFWAGYEKGRHDWGWSWHSPWYYRNFALYGGYWYDPWYYDTWGGWYSPYYYGSLYSWYDPWYFSYYGWGLPWYYHYYGGYPYYYYGGGGGGRHYAWNGNTGTINRDGSMRGGFGGYRGGLSSSRTSSLRNRTVGNHRAYGGSSGSSTRSGSYGRSGNSNRSNSGNFSGSRSGSYSNSSSGSFSGGGGSTRSSGGGGGGGRSGGGSLGGRR